MEHNQVDPSWLAHAKIAVASLAGGMVRLYLLPIEEEHSGKRIAKSIWLLFGCVTCGFYGAWPVIDWLELGDQYAGAVGAILGLVGMSFAAGFLKAVDSLDLKHWLSRLIGTHEPKN